MQSIYLNGNKIYCRGLDLQVKKLTVSIELEFSFEVFLQNCSRYWSCSIIIITCRWLNYRIVAMLQYQVPIIFGQESFYCFFLRLWLWHVANRMISITLFNMMGDSRTQWQMEVRSSNQVPSSHSKMQSMSFAQTINEQFGTFSVCKWVFCYTLDWFFSNLYQAYLTNHH